MDSYDEPISDEQMSDRMRKKCLRLRAELPAWICGSEAAKDIEALLDQRDELLEALRRIVREAKGGYAIPFHVAEAAIAKVSEEWE